MRSIFSKFALAAALALALAFTFSCSGGDDSESGGGTSSPSSSGGSDDPCPNVVTGDGTMSCGGQKYKTVVIGSQTWMAENLNYNVKGSVCYDKKESNCKKYGRLYTWATAMGIDAKYNNWWWGGSDVKHKGICPTSWHIPSKADWEELIDYVESKNGCWDCAGKYLKAKSDWNEGDNGLDTYEFSALPGGLSYSVDGFDCVGSHGLWWSASATDNDLSKMSDIGDRERVHVSNSNKNYLYSVRCLQDE